MDAALAQLVRERAGFCCEYCRMPQSFDPVDFQIDHVIAIKHHGATVAENLALACYACNLHKGPNLAGLDQPTEEIFRLFHPRHDVWSEHFEWNGGKLVGKTEIGRVTVDVLCINLTHRQLLRNALIAEGVFPPAAR
jgi:hypothetical protein